MIDSREHPASELPGRRRLSGLLVYLDRPERCEQGLGAVAVGLYVYIGQLTVRRAKLLLLLSLDGPYGQRRTWPVPTRWLDQ